MPSVFKPQSIPDWPSTRAVLFVHGIGNASAGGDGAFPIDAFKAVMGDEAEQFAVYSLNYDFINDWMAGKTNVAAGVKVLKDTIAAKFGGDELAHTIAEYAADVLWPVLSADIRLAVRDALVAQAAQILLDCGETALGRGDDPLDYQVSIIAHSLGCFHVYETLSATVSNPQYHLRPGSDLARLQSVWLMASPVQLIRSVGSAIRVAVPDVAELATLTKPLEIPAEISGAKKTPCARQFVSVVGGFLRGAKQEWAYMQLPGQLSVVDEQTVLGLNTAAALQSALQSDVTAGVRSAATTALAAAVTVTNPHNWVAYIERNAVLLRESLLS